MCSLTIEICTNCYSVEMLETLNPENMVAKMQDDYSLLFAIGPSCRKRTNPYTIALTNLAQQCMI